MRYENLIKDLTIEDMGMIFALKANTYNDNGELMEFGLSLVEIANKFDVSLPSLKNRITKAATRGYDAFKFYDDSEKAIG